MLSIVVALAMPLLVAKFGTGCKILPQDKILAAIIYQRIKNK
jgi:hypothetical protein